MKKFEIKDFFDIKKIKELEEECDKLKVKKIREGQVVLEEKIERQNNLKRLNQMGQMGTKFGEWGIEPED